MPQASDEPPAPLTRADMLSDDDTCGADPANIALEAYRLDANHTLVLVPSRCDNGAYNLFSTARIITKAGRATEAAFDAPTGMDKDDHRLVNASYNNTTRLLSTFSKGSGIGDCGVQQHFAWDGKGFRLVEQQEMSACRGAIDYIVTWRALVR